MGQFIIAPGAGARRLFLLVRGREHVIVHRDHHGNEDDRVVEEMEFDSREKKLQDATRYRLMPEIVVRCGLPDQQKMLDVMPELDPEGDHPPGMRNSGESFTEDPETN